MNKFIQYELWKDCRNGCKFCFNKGQQDLNKIESLNFVIDKLTNDSEIDGYNEVGFIGGEFFDNQLRDTEVKDKFYQLFNICAKRKEEGKLDKIYLTTSLVFDMDEYFIPFLEHLKALGILDITLLCTSYDSKYRFHNDTMLELWSSNMKKLDSLYPELKLHTEIIITQFFINDVLEDRFNIAEFKKEYNTFIDYIEPGSGFYYYDKQDMIRDLPDFFPTKKSFIKFLQKTAIENNWIDLATFISMEIRSLTIYCSVDNEIQHIQNRRFNNSFNESKNFKYEIGLIDSDIKMRKIVEQLYLTIGQT